MQIFNKQAIITHTNKQTAVVVADFFDRGFKVSKTPGPVTWQQYTARNILSFFLINSQLGGGTEMVQTKTRSWLLSGVEKYFLESPGIVTVHYASGSSC